MYSADLWVDDISGPLRNLILDHAPMVSSDTFQKHYLSRFVCADLWAIHRQLEPQADLVEQATSHGGSRDSRRIYKLTDQHVEECKQDRRYIRLTKKIEESGLAFTSDARKQLTRNRRNLLESLKRHKLEEVRKQWDARQTHIDIQRQLRGEDISKPLSHDTTPLAGEPMPAALQKVEDALSVPITNDLTAIRDRAANAINALVAYAGEQEPIRTPLTQNRTHPAEFQLDIPPEMQNEEIKRSTFVSVMGKRKVRRCFLCVATGLKLGRRHERFDDLCREHSRQDNLARHFTNVHLHYIRDDERDECPLCLEMLYDKNHVRRHADDVHGIDTDRKRPMRYRGEKKRSSAGL